MDTNAKLARLHKEAEQRFTELERRFLPNSSGANGAQNSGGILSGITQLTGSTHISDMASDLNASIRRPRAALEADGGLEEEIAQVAELLEAASGELRTKSEETKKVQTTLKNALKRREESDVRANEVERERDELLERCRLLEVENAVAVEQLSRSGLFSNNFMTDGSSVNRGDLPPRPGSAPRMGRAVGGRSPLREQSTRAPPASRGRSRSPNTTRGRSPNTTRGHSPNATRGRSPNPVRRRSPSPMRGLINKTKEPQNAVEEMVQGLKVKFEENGLSLPLEQISSDVYRLGNRRLSLKVQNGRLVVRVGGGFCDLIEFLEKVRI